MSNVLISKVVKKDKEKIVKFLIENHIYQTTKQNWNNLFEHNWNKIDNFGFQIKNEEEIVGYFGLIFSDQKLKGKTIVNLHSWVVKKEYRSHSIKLLREIMKLKDIILISHSTINQILKIYFKLQWKVLDENYYYIFGTLFSKKNIDLEMITNSNCNLLSNYNKKIYDSHNSYNSVFLKFNIDDNEVVIIGKIKVIKKYIPVFEIMFVSDLYLFNNNISSLIKDIKNKTNTFFCRIDSRFLESNKNLICKKLKMKGFKKIFYAHKENINDLSILNNLYSEIFLLNT